ncbi:MaoC family dehydratase [Mesorhizobium sp. A556]
MTKTPPTYEQLRTMQGQELGVSDWIIVDQARIDQFAECTGDRQWIHIDPERAKRQSPFRTTIAHGYLTLSVIGCLSQEMGVIPENTQAAFNYGLDRVRFISPVKVGSRIRLRATLLSMEDKGPGQYLMKVANTIEIDGEEKPALMAETLAMFYERRKKKAAAASPCPEMAKEARRL